MNATAYRMLTTNGWNVDSIHHTINRANGDTCHTWCPDCRRETVHADCYGCPDC